MDDYGNDMMIVLDWFEYLWVYLPQVYPYDPEII
jgi:hypothetical protein